MTLTSVEKALQIAAEDFGFKQYQISEEDIEQVKKDSAERNPKKILGNYFHKNLRDSLISFFCRDEVYASSVRKSANRWCLTYALEDWFYLHYSEQFPEFGDLDRGAIMQSTAKIPNNAYDGMRDKFNQASNHPRAFLAVAIYVKDSSFNDFDSGLTDAFHKKYSEILVELRKKGFSTYRRLPPGIPDDFMQEIDTVIQFVEGRRQVRDYKRIACDNIADVILDKQSEARMDLKENSLKMKNLLIANTRTERLKPEKSVDFVLDTLEEIKDWFKTLQERQARYGYEEVVIDKI